ncbi:MAG: hypothetical protein BroJett011_59440 [Chloroflexota bacterium]|nr:MAG: hypothetical protein BroJett011_59440 [Chloroflexota bacterium]
MDNTLALLRLKQAITDDQYRAALVDTVTYYQHGHKRSRTPVRWLPARPVGFETEVSSPVDPTRKVRTRYRVIDLNEPVTSNSLSGEINPTYDQSLQPRQRERIASRWQIEEIARKLDATTLLNPSASWADGPPLLGQDGMVESGNGRILALRRALEINPLGYAAYRQQLLAQAASFGFRSSDLEKIQQPLLVRERLTRLTRQARLSFINEANASGVARMGVGEQARANARLIPPGFFTDLHIAESDNGLADVLTKKGNAPIVARLVNLLPGTERAALMDQHGSLSTEGIDHLERAIFAYTMPASPQGERLARLIFEEGEAIDRIGAGLKQALPKLGQVADLVKAGQRRPEFDLGEDLTIAILKIHDFRQQGLSMADYLSQYKMFPELSPLQEQLLVQLDERRRSARTVAALLNAYTDEVMNTAAPNQTSLLGHNFSLSREDLLRVAIKKVGGKWIELRANPHIHFVS